VYNNCHHVLRNSVTGNLLNNFVSGTFCSRHIGQQLLDEPRELATLTLTFDFGGHGACLQYVLHLCTKLEVRRPFRSEDMMHFMTVTVDLETGVHYCPWWTT